MAVVVVVVLAALLLVAPQGSHAMQNASVLSARTGVASQIIAHRGACGYVPEHSVQAHQLAIDLGADYIEPDLVLSKDGELVVMHDILLDATTDVESKFVNRSRCAFVDGATRCGHFVSDFNLSELLTLRLNQRLPETRTTLYDGLFSIPTFDDIVQLVVDHYNETGSSVGIYAELKRPHFFASEGMDLVSTFVTSAGQAGYDLFPAASDLRDTVRPLVVQCFNQSALEDVRELTALPTVFLIVDWNTTTLEDAVDAGFDGVGPPLKWFTEYPRDVGQARIETAHDLGLAVHPWEFQADYLDERFNGSGLALLEYLYGCLSVDALFTEFPDQNREAIELLGSSCTVEATCANTASTDPDDVDDGVSGDDDEDCANEMATIVSLAVVLVVLGLLVVYLRWKLRQLGDPSGGFCPARRGGASRLPDPDGSRGQEVEILVQATSSSSPSAGAAVRQPSSASSSAITVR